MKVCTVCRQEKSLSEFFSNPGTLDRKASQCKKCDSVGKIHRNRKRKKKLVEALGGKCHRCEYDRCVAALEFHHPNDDKAENVSSLMYSWPRALAEAKKCLLLCANCHREEHDSHKNTDEFEANRKPRPPPSVHGAFAMYRKCGPPKCDKCRKTKSEYMKKYRAQVAELV